MSFCKDEGDEDAIEYIRSRLDKRTRESVSVFKYYNNLDEALSLISGSEIVVASRFHAAILGLLFCAKVLPMAYSDKTTNILRDMNFKGPVVDIRKIEHFDGSSIDFSSLETNDVSKQVQLAEKQFQELDKVLVKK